MARPQSGILPDSNRHALFLTLIVNPSGTDIARSVAARVPAMTDEVAAVDTAAMTRSVVGIGSEAWDRLYPDARPAQLRPFTEVKGQGGIAPATHGDLFLHIRGGRHDLIFELGRRIMNQLGAAVAIKSEIHGFRYLDSRDLTGFVDGTENPTGEHRAEVALVGDEDPGFSGGSYLAIQRYIHDLVAWERLSVADQEQIIARTKADDVELEAADKPATAHIKRVSIKQDGKSLEVLRHSMPYGTTAEHGLYFVAYGRSPDSFDKMLREMLVADADGHYDHLVNYSRAVTGANFFVPSRDWLEGQRE